jgi:3-deoxy-manno-octulosonate cytidylyltransferase (CMP-KDO synthetase)
VSAAALIPVRLQSSRLPRKALVDICGLPMVVHVYRRTCLATSLDDVFVVTDSDEIRDVVEAYGGRVLITSSNHETGTDRIAEAAVRLPHDIIVNVQGDEALVRPEHVDAGVREIQADSSVNVTLLVTPFRKYHSPSDIKAVVNERNDVLYLSRADIPSNARTPDPEMLKAYHVLAFRRLFLQDYAAWPRGRLELIEFNEYLRILERGANIRAIHVESDAISVDTPEDLAWVRDRMAEDALFSLYRNSQ